MGVNKMITVDKPWGSEKWWAHTDKYVGKVLYIKKGYSLSLQHHEVKDETIMILSGKMLLKVGSTVQEALTNPPIEMIRGDVYHIPPGTIHRMIAIEDTEVIEISTPEVDDVIRHQDDYGRVA